MVPRKGHAIGIGLVEDIENDIFVIFEEGRGILPKSDAVIGVWHGLLLVGLPASIHGPV